jgi:hypothetical protein
MEKNISVNMENLIIAFAALKYAISQLEILKKSPINCHKNSLDISSNSDENNNFTIIDLPKKIQGSKNNKQGTIILNAVLISLFKPR